MLGTAVREVELAQEGLQVRLARVGDATNSVHHIDGGVVGGLGERIDFLEVKETSGGVSNDVRAESDVVHALALGSSSASSGVSSSGFDGSVLANTTALGVGQDLLVGADGSDVPEVQSGLNGGSTQVDVEDSAAHLVVGVNVESVSEREVLLNVALY